MLNEDKTRNTPMLAENEGPPPLQPMPATGTARKPLAQRTLLGGMTMPNTFRTGQLPTRRDTPAPQQGGLRIQVGQLPTGIPTNMPNRLGLPTAPAATPASQPLQPIVNPTAPAQTPNAVPVAAPVFNDVPSLSPYPATNPNDPLTGRTIQRDPAQDRFAIAQQRFNTFVESTDPQYQAALRDANRYGAATGRLGSGDLRTDFGNLAAQRDLQLRTQGNTFLQNALEGTIDDDFRDLGVAQQQQGFQNQQQQQAFENELRRLGFSEDMLNSAFGRALQTYMAGQAGGTGSGSGIAVGQNQFNQGSDALEALNRLIRGQPSPVGTPPIAGESVPRYPWQTPIIPEGAA